MSTTQRAGTISRGGARFYVDSVTGDKHPGVTSILNMLPKPFLGPWAAKMAAECAVDSLGEMVTLAVRDRQGAIDYIKNASRRYTSQRGDIGTQAHEAFEILAAGKQTRVHPDIQPYVKHFQEFLDKWRPEFIETEGTVWCDVNRYAGSFDAVARIGDEVVMLDWKTSKDLHEEMGLQLSAYRSATQLLRPDGTRQDMYKTDGGAILHVSVDGWKLVPFACGEKQFEVFRHLRAIFDWDSNDKRGVIGKPLQ